MFQKLMALNPKQRPSIDEIRAHAWMQGSVPSYDEIKADFTERKTLVDQEAHKERSEKRARREDKAAQRENQTRRGPDAAQEEGETEENPREAWKSLDVQDYGPYFVQDYTQFFMTAQPLAFFEELHDYLTEKGVEPLISGDKLAVKFEAELPKKQTSGEEEE